MNLTREDMKTIGIIFLILAVEMIIEALFGRRRSSGSH